MNSPNAETEPLRVIELLSPLSDCDTSVFNALAARRTTRQISATPLPLQLLSNLLWAACGVNRRPGPLGITGRTAGSASNSQEIDIYVALRQGVYLYDPFDNRLSPIVAGDMRNGAMTPGQRGIETGAPVQLIYVADLDRLVNTAGFQEPGLRDPDVQQAYYYVDTGLIAGNVYLFAAAEGLGVWFHNCEKTLLAHRLGLRPDQKVLFAQSVGYCENP